MNTTSDGWDINHADELDWVPWGGGGARAKVLGTADGYVVALVEADDGYQGTQHEHADAEFFYLIDGEVTNQGETMRAGDGYAAAAGSRHDEFRADAPSRYISIFKL
jgi:hypothetical protein